MKDYCLPLEKDPKVLVSFRSVKVSVKSQQKKMRFLLNMFDDVGNKSFKPIKNYQRDSCKSLHKLATASLNQNNDYANAVKLPANEDMKVSSSLLSEILIRHDRNGLLFTV